MSNEIKLPWYKNTHIMFIIVIVLSLFILMNQCSMNNKMNAIKAENDILINVVHENATSIQNFETLVKLTIEEQFVQNLIYYDQLAKKQISTQDIQNKLDVLNKKLNEAKKENKNPKK